MVRRRIWAKSNYGRWPVLCYSSNFHKTVAIPVCVPPTAWVRPLSGFATEKDIFGDFSPSSNAAWPLQSRKRFRVGPFGPGPLHSYCLVAFTKCLFISPDLDGNRAPERH